MLMAGVLPMRDAVRVEELINYFDYDYDAPESLAPPLKTNVAVLPTPWNEHTKLIRIGIKGYQLTHDEKPRSNLVFLIDTSGSMRSEDKLPLVKNALRLLVDSLEPEDSLAIVTYAATVQTVLEPTTLDQSGKILDSLDRLTAGGRTAGGEGLRQAYQLAESNYDPEAVNRIILATDGDFNVGVTDVDDLQDFIERKREAGIYLSVLGFGRGNLNDRLMQALAQNGNGQAAYIDTLAEALKVMVDEASSTLFPISRDVKIQVEFNPAVVAEYRLIGYETRLLDREDFKNDSVDAGEVGSGHAVTALYEIALVGSEGRLVGDLRYQPEAQPSSAEAVSKEYAYLKIRYKDLENNKSLLIETPIGPSLEDSASPRDVREAQFAAAVAAFGQLLHGGTYMNGYSYDDVIELATTSKGSDQHGYRAEFLKLVTLAKSARRCAPRHRPAGNSARGWTSSRRKRKG